MDTQRAVLVDTFAAEPSGGLPIAVLPDSADLSDQQIQAAASELGTTVAVPVDGPTDRLRVLDAGGSLAPDDGTAIEQTVPAVVATLGHEDERETGPATVQTPTGEQAAEVSDDGRVWVDVGEPTVETADVEYPLLSEALGVDVAALEDVGADLPPLVVADGGVLVVPVNFLEHVSGVAPDPGALAEVAASVDVAAVCALTFDTLAADAAAHARTFVVDGRDWARTVGLEVPVTPVTVGGCLAHLHGRGTVETAQTVVEQGHFCDRPGRVHVDATAGLRVGGRTVTTLSGTVTLPADEDDGIIEA